MRRSAQRMVRLVAVAAVAIGIAGVGGASAGASGSAPTIPAGPFAMSARADSLQLQTSASGLPAIVPNGEVVASSPSSAQATLDAISSQAFASAPDPGGLVRSLPSTVNGLASGQAPPLPAYPLAVSTSNPTKPTASQQIGPYEIKASSSDNASSADARIGLATASPQVVSATSHASVARAESGKLVAEATTEIAPFRVNDLLAIGTIRGAAKVTYDPSKPDDGVQRTSSLSVGSLTIAGTEIGLTDHGLTLAGKTLLPLDLSALEKLLAPSGFSISYAPKTVTDSSVTSAALQLQFQKVAPSPLETITLTLTLGQVSASLTPGDTDSTEPTTDARTSTGTQPAVPAITPSGGATPGEPLSAGSLDTGTTRAPTGATPTTNAAPTTRPIRGVAGPLDDTSKFYLILVVGGLVALVGSRLNQWTALRTRFTPEVAALARPAGARGKEGA